MNDQHPHAGHVGYESHSTGGFDSDPLFGSLPGGYDGSYDTMTPGYAAPYDSGQAGYSGQYDTTQWDTGAHRTAEYDHTADYTAYTPHPQQHPPYEAAPQYEAAAQQYEAAPQYDAAAHQYDTTGTWAVPDGYGANIPAQGGDPDSSGQWDTSGWYANGQWASGATAGYDSGAYDATAWNTGATPEHTQQTPQTPHHVTPSHGPEQTTRHPYETYERHEAYEPHEGSSPDHDQDHRHDLNVDLDRDRDRDQAHDQASYDPYEPYRTAEFSLPETGLDADGPDAGPGDRPSGHEAAARNHDQARPSSPPPAPSPSPADAHRPVGRPVSRGGGRSRRRSPAKRSALLTVAVPSACVMSVAGIAAASVGGIGGLGGDEEKKDDTTTMAAADPGTVKPVAANNKLDTQLANLSADAENFADRASRTQERIDLKARQAAEKKKREVEAARKEALRPKYVMPVKDHRLSAYFGQAGVNWMSVHTGIDFPVLEGTPVMAATDGTVRTQFHTAYGNMAIVTMADGTETWYCHLSSTRIRSGQVRAGDVIAYSGDSGNSTGPHMHFEVRPGGGAAIDPLPWLRSHNVDPT
ncbi:M23 family metallopeptidase [Streptomyces brevispora]|uniref:M23 family metallopeptidase n=1 Tax=Streptomyces brevispora TaxID=887462 RepID=A0A561V0U7_9ACTN|nr:M23 family metallopeptidase [Streptomyces brevispora]TWG05183.1 murein DD-endopeptidase MepM/ murein hydrolase activator NlpD [Streptomyces brevispora]WSC13775.1 M23 family metallopeptidase [Streptomyces brevispora]